MQRDRDNFYLGQGVLGGSGTVVLEAPDDSRLHEGFYRNNLPELLVAGF